MSGIDAFVKALLHCDGTTGSTVVTDSAPASPGTFTCHGAAVIHTGAVKFGTAGLYIPGAGTDYVDTPDAAALELGAADFTIDFWFRTDFAATQMSLFGKCNSGLTDVSYLAYVNTNGSITATLQVGAPGVGNVSITTAASLIAAMTFYHLALVRSGSTLTLYLNGVSVGTNGSASGTVVNNAYKLGLGVLGEWTGSIPLAGYIDEFRLSVGVARWTTNFTPPTAAYDTFSAGVGASAGTSAVAGAGAAMLFGVGVGAAAGAAVVTGVGNSIRAGVGASVGAGVVTGIGNSIRAGVGASVGAGVVTGIGNSIRAGVGAAAGAATVTSPGSGIVLAVGYAAGAATVTGVGHANYAGVGFAAGVATVVGRARAFSTDTETLRVRNEPRTMLVRYEGRSMTQPPANSNMTVRPEYRAARARARRRV